MKNKFALMILINLLLTHLAQANEQPLCGELHKSSIATCGLQGCVETVYTFSTADTEFQVQFGNKTAEKTANRLANRPSKVCIAGTFEDDTLTANFIIPLSAPRLE